MSEQDAQLASVLFTAMLARHERSAALEETFDQLEKAGRVAKVRVHEFRCRQRGCRRGTVIKVGGLLVLRVPDYHLAPAANAARSTPGGRAKNTLARDNHWRQRTFDLAELVEFDSTETDVRVGVDLTCRHGTTHLPATEIARKCANVVPGHPKAPTLL